jgi:polyferredoxin
MSAWNSLCADAVVVVHALYVSFVVVGEMAIVLGMIRRWRWIGNFWFRAVHTSMIGLVVAESLLGIVCPLTLWENQLRLAAGQPVEGESFIGRWVDRLLFIQAPGWAFTLSYCIFGMLVVATLVFAPVRWPRGTDKETRRRGDKEIL